MPLPLSNSAEGGTNGVQVTTGNSGGASGDAFDLVDGAGSGQTTTFDTTAAHASLSYKIVSATSPGVTRLGWTTVIGTYTEIFGRCYTYQTVNGGTNNTIFFADLSGTGTCAWIANFAGVIRVADTVGNNTGAVAITLNTWVRVEFHIVMSATVGLVEAKLFNTPESLTPDETITRSSANTRASANGAYWGYDGQEGASQTFYLDDMTLNATGYPGPYSAPRPLNVLVGARW